MKPYTIIYAYLEKKKEAHVARLKIVQTAAATAELAIAQTADRCPATPTDIIVLKGEHYGRGAQ